MQHGGAEKKKTNKQKEVFDATGLDRTGDLFGASGVPQRSAIATTPQPLGEVRELKLYMLAFVVCQIIIRLDGKGQTEVLSSEYTAAVSTCYAIATARWQCRIVQIVVTLIYQINLGSLPDRRSAACYPSLTFCCIDTGMLSIFSPSNARSDPFLIFPDEESAAVLGSSLCRLSISSPLATGGAAMVEHTRPLGRAR